MIRVSLFFLGRLKSTWVRFWTKQFSCSDYARYISHDTLAWTRDSFNWLPLWRMFPSYAISSNRACLWPWLTEFWVSKKDIYGFYEWITRRWSPSFRLSLVKKLFPYVLICAGNRLVPGWLQQRQKYSSISIFRRVPFWAHKRPNVYNRGENY